MLLAELLLVVGAWVIGPGVPQAISSPIRRPTITNTEALGRVLYTRYVYYFQAAGLILLVAMIGAIVLTLRHKAGVKRQNDRRAGRAHARRPRSRCVKVAVGAGASAMTIGLGHYLTVAAILFTLGIFGIFLNRKNVIVILMSIELILLAVNINLVAFSAFLGDLVGQVFALFVLTVAAAEAAIGLAILVVYLPQPRLDRGRRHQPDEGLSGDVSGHRLPAAARRHHRRADRAGRRARRFPARAVGDRPRARSRTPSSTTAA